MQKVLIIDDDNVAIVALKWQLDTLHIFFDITVAKDGKSALRLLKKRDYDIVFTDMQLPDMHGIDIIKKLRQKEQPNKKCTKIIVLSASMTEKTEEACWQAKADGVFSKPITYETLMEIFEDSEHILNVA